MPLLDFLGIDNDNRQFTAGICFLDQEETDDYVWALERLRSLFKEGVHPAIIATDADEALIAAVTRVFNPMVTKTVLCFWHIAKNVLKHNKARFDTEERWEEFLRDFKVVVWSKTEQEYFDQLDQFKAKYHWNEGMEYDLFAAIPADQREQNHIFHLEQLAVKYVVRTWLSVKYRERVVHCWTDRFFTCGVTTTSRLEGAHRVLKHWIGNPSQHLRGVWRRCRIAINYQLGQLSLSISKKSSRDPAGLLYSVPVDISAKLYENLTGKISHHAIRQFQKQYQHYDKRNTLRAKAAREDREDELADLDTICTNIYYRSWGIPCWHMIEEHLSHEPPTPFQPLDFHPHWHINRPHLGAEWIPLPPPILDPIARNRRLDAETQRKAHEKAHEKQLRIARTGRILSGFEQDNRTRHCSACTAHNHDKKACNGCKSTDHTRSNCLYQEVDMNVADIQNSLSRTIGSRAPLVIARQQEDVPEQEDQPDINVGGDDDDEFQDIDDLLNPRRGAPHRPHVNPNTIGRVEEVDMLQDSQAGLRRQQQAFNQISDGHAQSRRIRADIDPEVEIQQQKALNYAQSQRDQREKPLPPPPPAKRRRIEPAKPREPKPTAATRSRKKKQKEPEKPLLTWKPLVPGYVRGGTPGMVADAEAREAGM